LNGSYTLNFEGILELVNSYLTIDGIYVENQGNLTSYAYDTEEMSYYELEGDMTYEYLEAYCTNLDAYDGIDYIFTGEEICPLANSEFEVDDGTLVVSWDDVTLMTTEPSVTLVVTGENPESTLGSVLLKIFPLLV
jgi:nitrite reductase/ring-hydroxylating ferredoxin subunit